METNDFMPQTKLSIQQVLYILSKNECVYCYDSDNTTILQYRCITDNIMFTTTGEKWLEETNSNFLKNEFFSEPPPKFKKVVTINSLSQNTPKTLFDLLVHEIPKEIYASIIHRVKVTCKYEVVEEIKPVDVLKKLLDGQIITNSRNDRHYRIVDNKLFYKDNRYNEPGWVLSNGGLSIDYILDVANKFYTKHSKQDVWILSQEGQKTEQLKPRFGEVKYTIEEL